MRNNRTEASPATDDAKDLPNKGGDDCPSAEERFTKFISGDYSTFSQSCNEVTDSDTQDQSLSLLQNENALTLTIYTSLPAYGPHLGKHAFRIP
jgi:hypothetical protein